jgi:hypothetical protein
MCHKPTSSGHSSGPVDGASTGAGIGETGALRTCSRKEDTRSMRPHRRLYVELTEVLVDLGRCCARATNAAMRSATAGHSGRGRS